ncbi:hypothetical protein GPK34_02205 [Secundilactobacillus kimchicus]|uniref:Uncharacterized protein n=1 Tax=Secundilactobacillus kimchicus JCM 15530 TaxID=1302272 RepID=A0A0R1HN02_9LACO|nr:hypothetical protein [Secundilactobacillus kimchicus]KRK48189.1 hypothetical protein FC96_GL001928 [Secundilactobacillus kimchicus JCM 15530]MBT9670851.1 hypothetical protein [Secundilactobacillus kimchicus]
MAQNLATANLEDDEPLYDAAKVVVRIDDKLVTYYNGQDMVSVTWTTDNVTMDVDAQGNGSSVMNHDDRGTITFHLNRASQAWQDMLDYGVSTGYHKIDISTPYEHIYTSKALLTKKPDINVTGGSQTVEPGFSCTRITLEKNTTD